VQSFPLYSALNQVALFKSESRCFMESDLFSYRLKETLCKRCNRKCVAADPADVGNTGIVEVWVQCPSCGDSWKLRFHKQHPDHAMIADRKIGRANRWRHRRQRPTLFTGLQE
jgi:RNase P subunit RPR2